MFKNQRTVIERTTFSCVMLYILIKSVRNACTVTYNSNWSLFRDQQVLTYDPSGTDKLLISAYMFDQMNGCASASFQCEFRPVVDAYQDQTTADNL